MNSEIKELIDKCVEDNRAGRNQPREVMLRLLELDENSEEAMYAREMANMLTHEATGDVTGLTRSIGIDYVPCAASCKFCSFGAKWGIVTEENSVVMTHQEVIDVARDSLERGATNIVLRTTEFYPHDDLVALVREMRAQLPGDYSITINTGELTEDEARDFYDAGVNSATHMIRLREGIDTPIPVQRRIDTAMAIKKSGMRWGSCMDPIGPEHTNEEIADLLCLLHELEPSGIGTMRRASVPGTPCAENGQLSVERVMLIMAMVRLCTGFIVASGTHPAFRETLYSGGCGFNVEYGAVPRDTEYSEGDWNEIDLDEAKALIEEAGFEIRNVSNSCC